MSEKNGANEIALISAIPEWSLFPAILKSAPPKSKYQLRANFRWRTKCVFHVTSQDIIFTPGTGTASLVRAISFVSQKSCFPEISNVTRGKSARGAK